MPTFICCAIQKFKAFYKVTPARGGGGGRTRVTCVSGKRRAAPSFEIARLAAWSLLARVSPGQRIASARRIGRYISSLRKQMLPLTLSIDK